MSSVVMKRLTFLEICSNRENPYRLICIKHAYYTKNDKIADDV